MTHDLSGPLQPKLASLGWAKDVKEAFQCLDSPDVQWIDVREPQEWAMFRIQGTTHIPMGELAGRLDELSEEKDIVVVCLSGERSAAVTAELRRNGYSNVYNLTGGLAAWAKAGLPIGRG